MYETKRKKKTDLCWRYKQNGTPQRKVTVLIKWIISKISDYISKNLLNSINTAFLN